jgi:hypothetical protein
MSEEKLAQIKARLAQGPEAVTRAEVEWLVKRVEELEKENSWMRNELSYLENQGDISF